MIIIEHHLDVIKNWVIDKPRGGELGGHIVAEVPPQQSPKRSPATLANISRRCCEQILENRYYSPLPQSCMDKSSNAAKLTSVALITLMIGMTASFGLSDETVSSIWQIQEFYSHEPAISRDLTQDQSSPIQQWR